MTRPFFIVASSLLFLIGAWSTGQGAWTYMKAELAQYLLERAWTKTMREDQHVAPWPWADTWPVARMIVPKHGIDLIVLAGSSGRTLAFGPGHVSGSALPGTQGTTILNGHRDTHFKTLEHLRPDDHIFLELPNGKHKQFTIDEIKIVDSSRAKIFHDDSTSRLVLITCYPFNAITPGGPMRYVVSGELYISESS